MQVRVGTVEPHLGNAKEQIRNPTQAPPRIAEQHSLALIITAHHHRHSSSKILGRWLIVFRTRHATFWFTPIAADYTRRRVVWEKLL